MGQKIDLSIVEITNPTSEDFTQRWNGEPYTIKAGESAGFARPVAYHVAKHLGIKMITEEALKGVSKKDMDNPNAAIHVKVSQLNVYDTHELRIALFKILKDSKKVLEVIRGYPFKGFIGEMSLYQNFVEESAKAA